ncbi:MAG: glutaredoxin family protein, partial [Methermicoccaceae archaeon]
SMPVKVYTTSVCPRCKALKRFLSEQGVEFTEESLEIPATVAELRINGVFVMEAPVLQVNDDYYTSEELFDDDGVNRESVIRALNSG